MTNKINWNITIYTVFEDKLISLKCHLIENPFSFDSDSCGICYPIQYAVLVLTSSLDHYVQYSRQKLIPPSVSCHFCVL